MIPVDQQTLTRIFAAVRKIERIPEVFLLPRPFGPRRRGGQSGGGGAAYDPGDDFILAQLTAVMRFSADAPGLPAYHWAQARITTDGAVELMPGGTGSKTIPSCDVRTIDTENATYSVLSVPAAAGDNLVDAAVDGATMACRITCSADTTHSPSGYRLRLGANFPPGGNPTLYHDSGVVASPPNVVVSNLPIGTAVYVTLNTYVGGVSANINKYILELGLNGEAAPTVAVADDTINDAGGALLASPVSGDYGGTIADGLTDLTLSWGAVSGADLYDVYVGSGNPADPEDPTGYDIYGGGSTASTSKVLSDMPADGTPLYVTLWWRIGSDWHWNRWEITITPAPDRRAIGTEDENTLARGEDVEPPDEFDNSGDTWIPELETELATPILVHLRRTLDAGGNDRFMFVRAPVQPVGMLLCKVIAVHRRRGIALVAPWIAAALNADTDPSIEANWENADNFADTAGQVHAWIGGYTGVQEGWPAILVPLTGTGGASVYTIIPFVQVHGTPPETETTEDANWGFWEPGDGIVGPPDVYINTLPADDSDLVDGFDDQYVAPGP